MDSQYDTVIALATIGLLSGFLIFGVIGYIRGKSIASCCDPSGEPRPKTTTRALEKTRPTAPTRHPRQ